MELIAKCYFFWTYFLKVQISTLLSRFISKSIAVFSDTCYSKSHMNWEKKQKHHAIVCGKKSGPEIAANIRIFYRRNSFMALLFIWKKTNRSFHILMWIYMFTLKLFLFWYEISLGIVLSTLIMACKKRWEVQHLNLIICWGGRCVISSIAACK